MKNNRTLSFLLLIIFLIVGNLPLLAQCAMCKTSAESDLQNGGSIATGLNTGTLYLKTIPYVILMIGGYLFFKNPIDEKIKVWKNKNFPSKSTN